MQVRQAAFFRPNFRVPENETSDLELKLRARSNVETWDTKGFFEDQVKGPVNLGLSENYAAIITAITAGFSMLMIIDIVFRLVVRMRTGQVSKHTIYRYSLMRVYSNPLAWLTVLRRRKKVHDIAEGSSGCNLQQNQSLTRYPRWKSALFVILPFILVICEGALIFVATNQNSTYEIDVTRVTAFEIEDRGLDQGIPPATEGCTSEPFTSKPDFKSLARIFVCSSFHTSILQPEEIILKPPYGALHIVADTRYLGFYVTYDNEEIVFRQNIAISLGNGTQYSSLFNGSAAETRDSLSSIFRRLQIPLQTNPDRDDEFDEGTKFSLLVFANMENVNTGGLRKDLYLATVVWAIFHTTGGERAYRPIGDSQVTNYVYLADGTDPLVINQRPWLAVLPSIIVCGSLLLFAIILNLIGLEGSIDDRWAWKEFSSDTFTIGDFGNGGR